MKKNDICNVANNAFAANRIQSRDSQAIQHVNQVRHVRVAFRLPPPVGTEPAGGQRLSGRRQGL